MARPTRRQVLAGGSLAAGSLAVSIDPSRAARPTPASPALRAKARRGGETILLSLKYSMIGIPGTVREKLALVAELGFDGVELDSPSDLARDEVLAARDASGVFIHGVVDSIHWQQRLSDPEPQVREQGVAGLETAIRDAHAYGGSSVLLVPGRVADPERENHDQVWERSIAAIRRVLPLAARLGVRVLIENVWNGFCYEHEGPADQGAERLAAYVDAIASPWVGVYFDIGNHRKYGRPEEWIRTLGPRIVKCDVKDWGVEGGWARIGEGDVDWEAVRRALADIGFTGWATAEVAGGDGEHLAGVYERMRRAMRG